MIECPECGNLLEERCDTTYSNFLHSKAKYPNHTGDIYKCEECDVYWLENFITNKIESWGY